MTRATRIERVVLGPEGKRPFPSNPKSYNDNQRKSVCLHRQGAGPTCWRHKNKTRLFSTSSLGRGEGSFREDPGLPFHRGKPTLPRDGPGSRPLRTASILSHCLALNARSRTQGRIRTRVGGEARGHVTHSTPPRSTGPRPRQEGPSWFHKSACIFRSSFIHSAVIYGAPPRLWRRL